MKRFYAPTTFRDRISIKRMFVRNPNGVTRVTYNLFIKSWSHEALYKYLSAFELTQLKFKIKIKLWGKYSASVFALKEFLSCLYQTW